eukprot:Skav220885  [mRNA]  locus=scaffold1977:58822:65105:- [translate_table: standard]
MDAGNRSLSSGSSETGDQESEASNPGFELTALGLEVLKQVELFMEPALATNDSSSKDPDMDAGNRSLSSGSSETGDQESEASNPGFELTALGLEVLKQVELFMEPAWATNDSSSKDPDMDAGNRSLSSGSSETGDQESEASNPGFELTALGLEVLKQVEMLMEPAWATNDSSSKDPDMDAGNRSLSSGSSETGDQESEASNPGFELTALGLEILKRLDTETKTELRKQLLGEQKKRQEAEESKAQWQMMCEAVEHRCKLLETQLHGLSQAPAKLNAHWQQRDQKRSQAAKQQIAGLQEQLLAMSSEVLESKLEVSDLKAEVSELKAQLEMKKSAFSLNSIVYWQYELDSSWQGFASEDNEKMHQAYLKYRAQSNSDNRFQHVCAGAVFRLVDFESMIQHGARNKRRIRLRAHVPPQWTTPPEEMLQPHNDLKAFYKEVTRFRHPEIWESVRKILQLSGHATSTDSSLQKCTCMTRARIISIHRIENASLWYRYKQKLAAMRDDHAKEKISCSPLQLDVDNAEDVLTMEQDIFTCGEKLAEDVNEKVLLHGTSYESANSIVRESFDHRTCQKALYGAGVYFASEACKSHQYTFSRRGQRPRQLIISRVALGDPHRATESRPNARRPPMRSGYSSGAGMYDSVVVRRGPIQDPRQATRFQIHQEFVIFDKDQAYPMRFRSSETIVEEVARLEARWITGAALRPAAEAANKLGIWVHYDAGRSCQGIHWMDQRGTSLADGPYAEDGIAEGLQLVPEQSPEQSPIDPDYKQTCSLAADEVFVSFGEASWDPETKCVKGVRRGMVVVDGGWFSWKVRGGRLRGQPGWGGEDKQFGGGPLSGHWSWLDQGGKTSTEWSAGEGWNMKYDFCFRDEELGGSG